MVRPTRRAKAAKKAKRNANGTFADSEDDMDIEFVFIDDMEFEPDSNVISSNVPLVLKKHRGPYRGDAPRTKRRKVAQLNHCLSVCPMKPLTQFSFHSKPTVETILQDRFVDYLMGMLHPDLNGFKC